MNKIKNKTKQSMDKKVDPKDEQGSSRGRLLKGVVVSDKMDKTAVVLVTRYKKHPKYKKRYKASKKYQAHDAKNEYQLGDKVIIQESRPMSKTKRWVVLKRI